ncbi:transglutaminase family protein [Rhizobacter sp. OV335]|uniref:transglutaminase family protein n=1 Tax=Rhizobacter sp. OV335 TaxID=1500264 RepID=UPI00090F60F4|nr:transglutaminase family protein [Rhizobacter sp. OV335]SHN33126.1 Transglutaminase-like superfamily protein [Rhizobacter sp. OV335]
MKTLSLSLAALLLSCAAAFAQHTPLPKPVAFAAHLQSIRAELEKPDEALNLGEFTLSVQRMIDPSIDVASNLQRLDGMARDIRATFPIMANSRVKVEALKKYLYMAGPWNDNRPFQYDLDDPLGKNLRNKLLSSYLDSHKGNCVSMPSLFVVLGQRIGLDVTLATVPRHIFVKYRDESGQLYNIEATSGGGFARDVWMRQLYEMTDLSLRTGIYMRPLSKKEAAVEMVDTLLEFYAANGVLQPRVDLALLLLGYAPKHVNGMLHLAAAYGWMAEVSYMLDYNSPDPRMPLKERLKYRELSQQVMEWEQRAQALGWRPSNPEAESAYLRRVEEARKSL